jgi:hypothetical protein
MDPQRTEQMNNDEALDREIRNALDVDPSHEFLARVRARIASEPPGLGWRPWRLVGVGALAASIVLTLVAIRFERTTDLVLPSAPGATRQMATPTAVPRALVRPPDVSGAAPPTRRRAEAGPIVRPVAKAEVLIPPGERAALRALVTNIRAGRIDASTWDHLTASTETMRELSIEPISIEPLSQRALLEGERP